MTRPSTGRVEPDDYTAVAADGPVVLVNVSKWRSDAIIVLPTGIEVVTLGSLAAADVEQHTSGFLKAVQDRDLSYQQHVATRAPQTPAGFHAEQDAADAYLLAKERLNGVLFEITEWLWDAMAAPVLDRLGIGPAAGGVAPRLWWCPTGLLTLLPLHAAGYHRPGAPDRRVMAHVVSSYTPTLDALTQARRRRPSAAEKKMLLVAQAEEPGENHLPSVSAVRKVLTETFAGRCTVLAGADATAAAVRAGLREHDWVHFSCHADQNLTDPFLGGPILHDTTLSIADISRSRYGAGEFAFLAACKTHVGGTTAPDEVITLASALHHAGFRHVVGTMWSIDDSVTERLVGHVYAHLADPAFTPDHAARALHDAVDALRLDPALSPSVWAPFTHTGP